MRTSRLEAFSDGVLAIIITIMVLELKVPAGPTLQALGGSATGFLTYLLSFVYVGIYWNNHHHMFQVVERVNGTVLWGNLHLLFWLSLFPVTTAWPKAVPVSVRLSAATSRARSRCSSTSPASHWPLLPPGWACWFSPAWPSCGSCPTDAWSGISRRGSRVPHSSRGEEWIELLG